MDWLKKLWNLCISDPAFLAAVKTIVDKLWGSLAAIPEAVDLPEFDATIAELTAGQPPEAIGDLIGTLRKLYQFAQSHPEILVAIQTIVALFV